MKQLIIFLLLVVGITTVVQSQPYTYDREIIVQLQSGVMELPSGQSEARIQDLPSVAPEFSAILLQFNIEWIAKAFPAFQYSDTLGFARTGEKIKLADLSNIFTLSIPTQAQRNAFIGQLIELPFVVYAEPNGGVVPAVLPNDEYFDNPSSPGNGGRQWSLLNTGQNFGTNDADIDAPEAWNISTGNSSTIIGIIDGGVENWHEDEW